MLKIEKAVFQKLRLILPWEGGKVGCRVKSINGEF
jgi:hypothetical protein